MISVAVAVVVIRVDPRVGSSVCRMHYLARNQVGEAEPGKPRHTAAFEDPVSTYSLPFSHSAARGPRLQATRRRPVDYLRPRVSPALFAPLPSLTQYPLAVAGGSAYGSRSAILGVCRSTHPRLTSYADAGDRDGCDRGAIREIFLLVRIFLQPQSEIVATGSITFGPNSISTSDISGN